MSEAITQAAAYDLIARFLRNNLYDDDYAKYSDALEALSQSAPSPRPSVPGVDVVHVGNLPTMNQDRYPALGEWWVQLWDGTGDDAKVIARVYGGDPQKAKEKAESIARAILALRPAVEPMTERWAVVRETVLDVGRGSDVRAIIRPQDHPVPAPSPQAPGRRKGPPGITLEPQGHEQPASPVVSGWSIDDHRDGSVTIETPEGRIISLHRSGGSGMESTAYSLALLALRPQAVGPMAHPTGDLPCGESSSDPSMAKCIGMGLDVCEGCTHGFTGQAEGGA